MARHQKLGLPTPRARPGHALEVLLERQLQEPLNILTALAKLPDDGSPQLVGG